MRNCYSTLYGFIYNDIVLPPIPVYNKVDLPQSPPLLDVESLLRVISIASRSDSTNVILLVSPAVYTHANPYTGVLPNNRRAHNCM